MRSRAFLSLALFLAITAETALAAPPPGSKLTSWLSARLGAGGQDSFIVLFDDPQSLSTALARARGGRAPAKNREVYDALRLRARATQASVREELTRAGIPFRPLYIVNGLAVRGDIRLAQRLARHGAVVRIVGDPVVRGLDANADLPAVPEAAEWGVLRIEADKVWNLDGKRGEGIVVASADTGVNWNHPALRGKYRGWNGGTPDHNYNWFDPVADTIAPFDDYPSTHGTHTTGTMVGDDGAGNQIGVAPSAQWIACRNMNVGNGQPSTYIACNQFFLAPYPHGGDPELDGDPSKAPDIVNNSWSCPPSEGCDETTLLSSFTALKAAGILAVASAGNTGSGCSSVATPPAIYEEAFVVGATDASNTLAGFSSRGPVTVDASGRLRPDVVAPGVSIRSSINTSSYGPLSGTSMAGPHAAGAAALLWSAKPQVRGLIRITRCLMSRSARGNLVLAAPPDQICGGTNAANRPNNLFGYGLIDAYDAIHYGPDGDVDGIADDCDCAPGNGGAYDAPPTVEGLGFGGDKSTLGWTSIDREAGNGTIYDTIRGDLFELRATGGAVTAVLCLGGDTTETRSDTDLPLPDAGFYYLVGAGNACGDSGFGTDSSGAPRAHPACL